jgi:hypothetical protein
MHWEYKTTRLDFRGFLGPNPEAGTFDEELNTWGSEGWELVSTVPIPARPAGVSAVMLIFKRPSA